MAARVFISYSHKDEAFLSALREHLAMLRRDGLVEVWHDQRLRPGDEWAAEIRSPPRPRPAPPPPRSAMGRRP